MAKMVGKWPKWCEKGQHGGKMAGKWPKWWNNGYNGGKMAEMAKNLL